MNLPFGVVRPGKFTQAIDTIFHHPQSDAVIEVDVGD